MAVHVIVMGVSGSGKSSVAAALGTALGAEVIDADDHHPASNIAKMSAGVALTDEDRWPWLRTLAGLIAAAERAGRPTVMACSALRRAYRDALRAPIPAGSTFVIHLDTEAATADRRLKERDHFMPPTLLASQLSTLEPLEPDEAGARVDADRPLAAVVADALDAVTRATTLG